MPEWEKFPGVPSALGSAALCRAGRAHEPSAYPGRALARHLPGKGEVAAFIKPTQTDEGLQLACEYEF
jgi:hypothetical protein